MDEPAQHIPPLTRRRSGARRPDTGDARLLPVAGDDRPEVLAVEGLPRQEMKNGSSERRSSGTRSRKGKLSLPSSLAHDLGHALGEVNGRGRRGRQLGGSCERVEHREQDGSVADADPAAHVRRGQQRGQLVVRERRDDPLRHLRYLEIDSEVVGDEAPSIPEATQGLHDLREAAHGLWGVAAVLDRSRTRPDARQ